MPRRSPLVTRQHVARPARCFGLLTLIITLLGSCASDDVVSLADVAPPIGTCFTPPTGEPSGEGTVFDEVPCADEHVGEAIGRAELRTDPDAPFPGEGEMRVAATNACVPVFEDYVGIAYVESRYTLQPIAPDVETWSGGDRSVACIVVQLGVPPGGDVDATTETQTLTVTGSVRGAAA